MKLNKKVLVSSILINVITAAPFVLAATSTVATDTCKSKIALTSIGNIFNYMSCTIITSVLPFLFTLAVAAFIWGIIQYFLNPDNEEKRKAGKSYIIWGLISLFVMTSMWGIVNLLSNTFGVKTLIPQLSQ